MNKFLTLVKFTFFEYARGKLLPLTVASSIIVFLVTFVSTEFTFGASDKVAVDISLGMLFISTLILSIYVGSNVISEEINSRTIYMVLSRPISKRLFLTSKIIGVLAILSTNFIFLFMVLITLLSLYNASINLAIIHTCALILFEGLVIFLFAIIFSIFTNKFLTAMYCIGIDFIGHFVGELKNLKLINENIVLKNSISAIEYSFPMFFKIDLKPYAFYPEKLGEVSILNSYLYITVYALILWAISLIIFEKKNLD